ncbi:MAG TPA: CAP domain-containing protein [Pyrinomonadaceae bacterium]|jgi:uncharacterized protein YkwD
MKNNLFAGSKLILRAFFAAFVVCLLMNQSAFSQKSKTAGIAASTNAYTNLLGGFGDDENEIFTLVNQERRKKRLGNLSWDDRLARVARKYSQQMAKGNFFGHFDKNGNGVEERAEADKIKWKKIGENLFFCQGIDDFDAAAVIGWMKSPGHRENILDKDWTTTGIGVAESRDGKIYVTQVFVK